jgi:hypothetical protein
MRTFVLATSVILALAAAVPVDAQGQSPNKGKKKGTPPSRSPLTAPPLSAPAPSGATPLAWIDDASLLGSDLMSVSFSAAHWTGDGVSETSVPVLEAAYGLAPRLQLSVSVPHVIGSSDPTGAAGGLGTSFLSAKIALYDGKTNGVKLAVAPTLEVLGSGVMAALGPDESRTHFGLPVSAEIGQGPMRLYGGGGYFSPGLWYTGGAVSARATDKVYVSAGVSRAWSTQTTTVTTAGSDRKELSFGAAYVLTPRVTTFGSLSQTFETLAENGAGTSIVGGISFAFVATGR